MTTLSHGIAQHDKVPHSLRVVLISGFLLMAVTFSAPGREGSGANNGLDLIGLGKLAVRAFVILLLVWDISRVWQTAGRSAVVWCLTPFAIFLAWSLVTVAWSPLKTMSLGQLGSLVAQVLLMLLIALRWRSANDTSRLIQHLVLALCGIASILVVTDFLAHDISGLNREESIEDASTGLVHPTSAGATASLGVVILVLARALWGWSWSKIYFIPGLLASGALLYLAQSRTSAAMTLTAVAITYIRYSSARFLAGLAFGASVLLTLFLIVDPGMILVDDARAELVGYVRRGESDEQMESLNGRGALWDAIWAEFLHSPLIGHGYFITSRSGILDVWSGPAMRTAHNFFLQVLASTGLVGLVLFVWAMARPIMVASRLIQGDEESKRLRAFLLVVGLWYFGWGQLCESFMGPVQPESVVFYSMLGIALAYIRLRQPMPNKKVVL